MGKESGMTKTKFAACACALALALACAACGKADPQAQTLNQALRAANEKKSGTLTLHYVEQGEAFLAERIEYTRDGKNVQFTKEEYEVEGGVNRYKYENGVLYSEMEDAPGKYEVYDSKIEYRTLSDIAGVNLGQIEGETGSVVSETAEGQTVYTVTVPQSALVLAGDDEKAPVVIDALTKQYTTDSDGTLVKVTFAFTGDTEMNFVVTLK